ncbi:MAG: M20 family metallo-hydrolase [Thermoplasmata archaeon]|nr:MAG: M20 family metallo-hydrolase [Thermoplasmata archaeon]
MLMPDEKLMKVHAKIESYRDEMIRDLGDLIRIPAISPKSGGEGENKKAEFLLKLVEGFGFDDIERIDVPDESAPDKMRPNIIARIKGQSDAAQNIWVVVHMDVVPEGDLKLWDTDPYEPVVKDGKIFGRGVEDNGQELIAALYSVRALKEEGILPENNINIAIVADEETGSDFGIRPLIEKGLFTKDDLIIVPDGGNSEGTLIEVSEKTIMWLKIRTVGKQCHGSMPERGINAHKAAMKFGVSLDEELHRKYSKKDELFDPPISTFEPTKKEGNVPNINTIPGEDIYYMDCRILPDYDPEEVFETIKRAGESISQEIGAKFEFERPQYDPAAPPTSPESPAVLALKEAIKTVYDIVPYAGGIGGGTCAAIFRRAGYPAVVWAKLDDTCHAPNEYAVIDNIVNDAKVYASMFCK